MKNAQIRWLHYMLLFLKGTRSVAFKYIITNTPKKGDKLKPTRPFLLVKKAIKGNRSTIVWRRDKKALQGGETVLLEDLQNILGADLFSKFILILVNDKINTSKKRQNNYWAWEIEDPNPDTQQTLFLKIMELFPTRQLMKTPQTSDEEDDDLSNAA